MAKDWIVIRVIFSGALIVFGIVHMLYTVFSKMRNQAKFNKDLHDIKHYDIQKIVADSLQESENLLDNNTTKKEMENLLKNIYFNLYNQHKDSKEIQRNYGDIETSIDHVLDNSILNIIEEKERLLQEKDKMIAMLEEKNEKFINDTIGKITYIVDEKDKLLREKDNLIIALHKKIQSGEVVYHRVAKPQTPTQSTAPKYHYSENFINVNG